MCSLTLKHRAVSYPKLWTACPQSDVIPRETGSAEMHDILQQIGELPVYHIMGLELQI
jgi:hypothetical protein